MKTPLRISSDLILLAKTEAATKRRSVPNQIEYWAELGKAVEHVLNLADVYAVLQGIKKITVEPVVSEGVNPETVFNAIDQSRQNGTLAEKVTSAAVYYESSLSQPGLLDRVNSATGEKKSGRFAKGKFIQV